MKRIFLLSLLTVVSLCIYAQAIYTPDTVMSRFFLLQQLTGEKYMDAGHRNIGMYFIEDWTRGSVLLASGEQINDLNLHYNGFQDQLLWLKNKTVQITLDKNTISEFLLANSGVIFHFKKLMIKNANDSAVTYCQEIYEGKIKLFVIRRNKLDSEMIRYNLLYYTYVPIPVYCIFVGNKTYFLNNIRTKSIYKAFPASKESIRERIRQMHLRIRNEADFFKVIMAIEDILVENK